MKITEHFDSSEFACKDGTSYPEKWFYDRLIILCSQLEIIRKDLGSPIEINSGYRTPTYNTSIGGARASQHIEGRAADIRVKGYHPITLKERILALRSRGLISIGGLGLYSTFVHVDIRPSIGRMAYWEGSRSSN